MTFEYSICGRDKAVAIASTIRRYKKNIIDPEAMRKRGFVTGIPFFERRVEKPLREWSVVDYLPIEIPFSKSPHLPVIRFHGDVPCLHGRVWVAGRAISSLPAKTFPSSSLSAWRGLLHRLVINARNKK